MAVQYIREKTKQKYYLIIFGIVILITFVIVWFGFLKDSSIFQKQAAVPTATSAFRRSEININYDLLESQTLKDMDTFEPILPFEGQIGKENPFSATSALLSGTEKETVEEEAVAEEEENPETMPLE